MERKLMDIQESSNISIITDENIRNNSKRITDLFDSPTPEECIDYDEALTNNEILKYSIIVNQFKDGKIDYQTLKEMFLNMGISIEPIHVDVSKMKAPIGVRFSISKRIKEQKYLYDDIKYFILNSNDIKNVIFIIGYKAIELLADYGIPEYQERMISLLKFELNHTYDNDAKMKAKRNVIKRRIRELEIQLAIDTDKLTSDVKEAVKNGDNGFTIPSVYLDENGELKSTGPKLIRKKDDK